MNKSINDKFMSKDEQEQYSFGPWLVVVDSKELIPPQYLDYERLIMDAEFCIKVPVNKDRQTVKPGELMYKEVIIMDAYLITILTYNEKKIFKEDIKMSEIDYVIRGGELLHNYITFGTKSKTFTISYYSVSYDINSKIIKYIRKHFQGGNITSINETLKEDFFDNNLYKFFQKSNQQSADFHILGYQKESLIPFYANVGFGRIKNKFKSEKIEEIMFLASAQELVIISGDIDKAKKSSVDYSYRHMYIRIDGIKKIRLVQDDVNENIYLLELSFERNRLKLKVEESYNYKYLTQLIAP